MAGDAATGDNGTAADADAASSALKDDEGVDERRRVNGFSDAIRVG